MSLITERPQERSECEECLSTSGRKRCSDACRVCSFSIQANKRVVHSPSAMHRYMPHIVIVETITVTVLHGNKMSQMTMEKWLHSWLSHAILH